VAGCRCMPGSVLDANDGAYRWLVARVRSAARYGNANEVLARIERAAAFAAWFHSGRFADGAIENPALEIGHRLDVSSAASTPIQRGRRRILHVTTRLLAIGGHSRMILNWVLADTGSTHSIALVDQGDVAVPPEVLTVTQRQGGWVGQAIGSSRIDRARWLRAAAERFDMIVLHHFAADVVPTVAFAAPGGPPVTILNHADHQFWLGSSVADAAINLRSAGARHTAARRYISTNVVLPVPLVEQGEGIDRRSARQTLGIDDDRIVLLSVGRAEKYRPSGEFDFVRTAGRILDRLPDALLYVVGESIGGIRPYLRSPLHDRLHFVGELGDSRRYRAAADVYLESFPFGSQTALLEAALDGLPAVRAYSPLYPLLVANDDSIEELLPPPRNEDEYIQQAAEFAKSKELRLRLGETIRNRLLSDHSGEGWRRQLNVVYEGTGHLTHNPRPIPESDSCASSADNGLSLWHVSSGGSSTTEADSGARIVLHHAISVRRWAGDYRSARRIALRAVMSLPSDASIRRLFILSLLGVWISKLRLMRSWIVRRFRR